MRILIVSYYYEPEMGAAPSRITNLAKGLKTAGVDVDILTCLPNYPKGRIFDGYRGRFSVKEEMDGITVYRYWTYATVSKSPFKRVLAMMAYATTLWNFMFKRKLIKSYDRIIIQSPPILVSASAVMLFKKIFKKKILLNVSDLWPLSAVELGFLSEGSTSHKILSIAEKYIYKNADAVMGQSKEIIEHISSAFSGKPSFLYRNLLPEDKGDVVMEKKQSVKKIVYAGLFGVAQDLSALLRSIDFKKLGVEMHLYGGGNQLDEILSYMQSGDKNIYYHGYLPKSQIDAEIVKYDLSIIPLTTHIHGAVPSKIFDLMPLGIPMLFSGDGEGADIVKSYGVGLVSSPGDYKALEENIRRFVAMDEEEYSLCVNNCLKAAKSDFCFKRQMDKFVDFLRNIG